MSRLHGKIKMFFPEKGFGFIREDNLKEHFFHFSELLMDGYRTVDEGQDVDFELSVSPNGRPCAVRVEVRE